MSSRNVGKKTERDWKESFYSMEQQYLTLKKKFNEKENELQMTKVEQRKKGSSAARSGGRTGGQPAPTPLNHSLLTNATTTASARVASSPPRRPSTAHAATTTTPSTSRRSSVTGNAATSPYASGSSQKRSASGGEGSNTMGRVSQSDHVRGGGVHHQLVAPPPDPMMVWGVEDGVAMQVQSNALFHVNQKLRDRLDGSEADQKQLKHDIAVQKELNSQLQNRVDVLNVQAHELVRERDLSAQRMASSQHMQKELEDQIQAMRADKEQLRYTLEGQLRELRNRLAISADKNDTLTRDVRLLMTDLKERAGTVSAVQSKLTLTESSLIAQRNTNESLLLELKSMNEQLVSERKRMLTVSREAQVASLSKNHVAELKGRLEEVEQEKQDLERKHVQLLDELVHTSQAVMQRAEAEVHDQIHELKQNCAHWERVSQLQYKDITERTHAHLRVREECDEAKRTRDEADQSAKAMRAELLVAQAKLDIVWPTHKVDTRGLDNEAISAAFSRLKKSTSSSSLGGAPRLVGFNPRVTHTEDGEVNVSLPGDVTDRELILELQEANAALSMELESARVSNELLAEQVKGQKRETDRRLEQVSKKLNDAEEVQKTGKKLANTQSERIKFLEDQVSSLRGAKIDANTSLQSLTNCEENILELFIGQLLGTSDVKSKELAESFPLLFCSIDFLLHETVTTRTVNGFGSFLDTTSTFKVMMDNLLLYALCTRGLHLQLCRVTNELQGTFEVVGEGYVTMEHLVFDPETRESKRPLHKGHVALYSTSTGIHLASVEFCVTLRASLSEEFKKLAETTGPTYMQQQQQHPNSGDVSRVSSIGGHSRSIQGDTSAMNIGPSVSFSLSPRASDLISQTTGVSIFVKSVKIAFSIPRLPKLSACYLLHSFGDTSDTDVFIPCSEDAKYETQIPSDVGKQLFAVRGVEDIFSLLREPLAIFFFDESSSASSTYWAVAITSISAEMLFGEDRDDVHVGKGGGNDDTAVVANVSAGSVSQQSALSPPHVVQLPMIAPDGGEVGTVSLHVRAVWDQESTKEGTKEAQKNDEIGQEDAKKRSAILDGGSAPQRNTLSNEAAEAGLYVSTTVAPDRKTFIEREAGLQSK